MHCSNLAVAAVWATPFLALALPIPQLQPTISLHVDSSIVLEYNASSAYSSFRVPCARCGADESVVLDFQVQPVDDTDNSGVVFNGNALELHWENYSVDYNAVRYTQCVYTNDTSGTHEILVAVTGYKSYTGARVSYETLDILILAFDDTQFSVLDELPGFHVVYERSISPKLLHLVALPTGQAVLFSKLELEPMTERLRLSHDGGGSDDVSETSSRWSLEVEVERLLLLEAEADTLKLRIKEQKHLIDHQVKENEVSLHDAIKQCDGFVCAAKAIAENICDKVKYGPGSHVAYAKIMDPSHQRLMSFQANMATNVPQNARNCTKSNNGIKVSSYSVKSDIKSIGCHRGNDTENVQAIRLPLMLTKNASQDGFTPIELVNPTHPLLRAFQIICAALGLSALFAYIRRKCMSMRKRVDRLADLEERRNARAYRRAARRAYMRRRWNGFIATVKCFRAPREPRKEDYEEKRALILQEAFLEQSVDQAEKGEVMEAEIRELRHAHEIVAALFQAEKGRYNVRDLPPPLVPLPYTPMTARSRASTGTLPSYTSESLPDYSSRLESDTRSSNDSSSLVADGFHNYTPTTTDEEGRYTPVPSSSRSCGSSSAARRYTPTSSVAGISPRCSEETLRTRQSKDTQDF